MLPLLTAQAPAPLAACFLNQARQGVGHSRSTCWSETHCRKQAQLAGGVQENHRSCRGEGGGAAEEEEEELQRSSTEDKQAELCRGGATRTHALNCSCRRGAGALDKAWVPAARHTPSLYAALQVAAKCSAVNHVLGSMIPLLNSQQP